ncbi:MAG: site-2 protease family protein [Actinomycetota bacterium]|nr:site-2 protease family protein [Actinomycetota bacterium]
MTPTQTTEDRRGQREDPTREEQRAALVRLGLILLGAAVATVVAGVTTTVAVVLAIILMIMLHELGHFVTAKWAGMKVTEFFLGFGPRLWSVRKGETEYGVKAIPAGGYVKIIGMSNLDKVDPADEDRTYRQKPYWRRLSVAVAGSTVHFILAFLLLWTIFTVVGVPDFDRPLAEVGSISRLESGPSPAEQAGLKVGDRLLTVDGQPVNEWNDVPRYIRAHPGQPIRFGVERDGRRLELVGTPLDLSKVDVGDIADADRPTEPTGFLGIGSAYAIERLGPVEALGRSATGVGRASVETVKALGTIFSPNGATSYGRLLTGGGGEPSSPDDPRFLSPVGFVRVASQAADTGLREVLGLLFSINVFVGLFNMIPLLPLDGGHVAIATYERLRSRRGRRYHADVAKAMPVYYMVFLMIIFLGVTSLYLDIVRPIANPFE